MKCIKLYKNNTNVGKFVRSDTKCTTWYNIAVERLIRPYNIKILHESTFGIESSDKSDFF